VYACPHDAAHRLTGERALALADARQAPAPRGGFFATIGRLYLGPFVAQRVVCPGLTIAAAHALSGRDAASTVTILTAAPAVLRSFGTIAPPPVARQEQELLAAARGDLTGDEFERATAAGSGLDLPGVLRLAGLPTSPAWEQQAHKGKDGRLDAGAH